MCDFKQSISFDQNKFDFTLCDQILSENTKPAFANQTKQNSDDQSATNNKEINSKYSLLSKIYHALMKTINFYRFDYVFLDLGSIKNSMLNHCLLLKSDCYMLLWLPNLIH